MHEMIDIGSPSYVDKDILHLDQVVNQLFNEALDAIVFWDKDERIVNANESALRLFECNLEELKKYPISDFVYEKNEKYYTALNELLEKGSTRGELLFQMYNGQLKYVEFTCKLYAVENFHMTIYRNVTERYQMEKELRDSENKFRNVFEGSLDGMVLWDENYRIVDINRAGERYLHTKKENIIGSSLHSFLTYCQVSEQEFVKEMNQLMIDGVTTGELIASLPNKKVYFEYSSKHNVFSHLSLTTFRDITEKLELEEKLHKSDTLSVIGQLAAGIAHEIRNPMTALKGFIQLLEDSYESKHEMYFSVISSELNRIDTIINEFLILAKPQSIKYELKSIADILKETVHFLSAHALLYNIQFQVDIPEYLPRIVCEPNQLKKVFINIIKNGIEVMPHGGVITIKMEKNSMQQLHISIADEGCGIPAEKLKRLGEPFYTTKERGTGLGLMVSYRIVEDHGGSIVVESEVDKGTTFHINLPIKSR